MELGRSLALLAALVSVASAQTYTEPNCDGKQVIVQLFEWTYEAVANECENYLGPKGFCGVQISPASEHIYGDGEWWIRYQPVSYILNSRSGTRDQLADMITRCSAVGVNVYADVVFNQCASGSGVGWAGSSYDAGAWSYPAIPFSYPDFNDYGCTIDYQDEWSVRNCALEGMPDINQGTDYVRGILADYMNDLLSLGVMGFRVDAAKHMWPGDLEVLVGMLNDDKYGNRPLVYQEVIDYHTEPITMDEYFGSGKVTEFNYGATLKSCIENSRDYECLRGFGEDWFISGVYALVFVDNHDTQRNGQALYYDDCCGGYEYKLANAFHLGHEYGMKRVMSSYYFSYSDQPPPGTQADQDCGGGWVCEHRWPVIMNMVQFTNACSGEPVENYDVQGDVVGFSRGSCGFVAIGEAAGTSFYTGMPDGTYCDIVSECAQSVTVSGGYGTFTKYTGDEPAVAICVGCS